MRQLGFPEPALTEHFPAGCKKERADGMKTYVPLGAAQRQEKELVSSLKIHLGAAIVIVVSSFTPLRLLPLDASVAAPMIVGGVDSTRRDRDTERGTLTDIFLNTYTVDATLNLSPSIRERSTPGGGKSCTKRGPYCTFEELRVCDHILSSPLSYAPLLSRARISLGRVHFNLDGLCISNSGVSWSLWFQVPIVPRIPYLAPGARDGAWLSCRVLDERSGDRAPSAHPRCRWRGPLSLFRPPCRGVCPPLLSTPQDRFFVHALLFLARACGRLLIAKDCIPFLSPTCLSNVLLLGNEPVAGVLPWRLGRPQRTVCGRVGGPRGFLQSCSTSVVLVIFSAADEKLSCSLLRTIPDSCLFSSSFPSGILPVLRFHCSAYSVSPRSQRWRDYVPHHRRPQVSLVGPGMRLAAVWPSPQVVAMAQSWPLVFARQGRKRVS